jgi:hypothetical protein
VRHHGEGGRLAIDGGAACRHQSDRQSKGKPGTGGRKLPKQKDVPRALHVSKVEAPERDSKVAAPALRQARAPIAQLELEMMLELSAGPFLERISGG